MQANFWFQKWQSEQIGFHRDKPNPALLEFFGALSLTKGSRVCVPLCGKTLDIAWLLARGCRVVGIELVETAVEQLFLGLELKPTITDIGTLKRYRAKNIDVFVGDIFEVSKELLGSVDAVYDRAALVALPEPVRERYAAHLVEITANAPQLLVTYDYDQTRYNGPPFSVSHDEVRRRYGDGYEITPLVSRAMPGGVGGTVAKKTVWLLEKPLSMAPLRPLDNKSSNTVYNRAKSRLTLAKRQLKILDFQLGNTYSVSTKRFP